MISALCSGPPPRRRSSPRMHTKLLSQNRRTPPTASHPKALPPSALVAPSRHCRTCLQRLSRQSILQRLGICHWYLICYIHFCAISIPSETHPVSMRLDVRRRNTTARSRTIHQVPKCLCSQVMPACVRFSTGSDRSGYSRLMITSALQ